MNNFKCEKGHEFFVAGYRMIIKPEKTLYYIKDTNILVSCPECKSIEISSIEKPGNYENLKLGKYTMKTIQQRQEHLKKRSHDHFVKEIKDKKYKIDHDPSLQQLN